MNDYIAPLREIRFVMEEIAGLERVALLPGGEDLSPDLVRAILDEAAVFAQEVLAPLNRVGDLQGARWHDGEVTTPDGFRQAYRGYVDGGWNGLRCDPRYGGQGLPHLVATAVDEMVASANMAFGLSPALNMGAVEALQLSGSEALKNVFLPKMVSGEWAGTMNLTEPQAGSDLAAIRTRAIREGNHYRIAGQKIFITFGEHDFTDNIIHLVLARTPDAPEGVKGISLFVVPKFLVNQDGSLGERNDVRCVSIENKLGIHGCPTAVMSYGDAGGAIGYLVGEENRGLEYMFIMMNMSRLHAGLQGVAIGERAYQKALAYARERVQGGEPGSRGGPRVALIRHPDVRRMLLSMKSRVEAGRALAYHTAALLDLAERDTDAGRRRRHLSLAELLTPVVKAWCSEMGQEIASVGIQIHGGMGFIEETGAAQFYRDIRIATIYEGTTAIQANDLIGRKLGRDGGQALIELIGLMKDDVGALRESADGDCRAIGASLAESAAHLDEASRSILAAMREGASRPLGVAVPFLMLLGHVCGGWQMGRAALAASARLAAGDGERDFHAAKLATARFYAAHVLPQTQALLRVVSEGAESLERMEDAFF